MSDSLYTIKKLYARYSLTDEHPGIFARKKQLTDQACMYAFLGDTLIFVMREGCS